MAIATALLPNPTERAFLTLERVLTRAAISAARTALRLGAVARRHEVIEASARAVEHVIGQIRAGLAKASPAAAASAQAAERVVALTSESRALSAGALDAVDRLVRHGENSDARLQQLLTRVQEVAGASRLIDDIAVKTRFLALNATIEASRAGPAGRTFAVVANEVRELANSTADKTRKIQDLVKAIIVLAQPAREDLEHSRALGETAVASMTSVDQQLAEIHHLASQTSIHANDIARVIEDEHRAVGALSSASTEVATAIAELRTEAHQLGQTSFRVSGIADEGFHALCTIDVNTAFHRGLAACEALADETSRIFGRAVDRGLCSLEALLALRYEEIKGPAIAKLARLFDVSRVPVTGFTPAKYHTGYDAAIDRELQVACDAIVDRDPALLFALAIDLNSYAPIHNRRFMQDWTGEPAKDLSGNRVKRFFTDNAVLVRGARVGLPPAAAALPDRASRADFQRTGARLSPSSTEPRTFMCQTYARDTGALITVVTVPIYVHGHRWGAALVGWTADEA